MAFERLTPAWADVQVKGAPKKLEKGLKIDLTVRKFGIPVECQFVVTDLETDKFFADQQLKGPFAFWRHEHKFVGISDSRSLMNDSVQYSLPLGFLSEGFAGPLMDKDLERLFRYRHEILKNDLSAYMRNQHQPRMHVLVCCTPDALRTPLASYLSTQGHSVLTASFNENANVEDYSEILSRPIETYIHVDDLGSSCRSANLGILNRLVESKHLKTYIEVHDTHDNSNENFEQRCAPLRAASVRCAYVRTGAILSAAFGVLKNNANWKSETQPWVAVDDVASAIEYCMLNESIDGQIHISANQKKPPTKEFRTMLECGYPFRYQSLTAARKHVLGL